MTEVICPGNQLPDTISPFNTSNNFVVNSTFPLRLLISGSCFMLHVHACYMHVYGLLDLKQ